MGFPTLCGGIFPTLLLNVAVSVATIKDSVATIKDTLNLFLLIVGLRRETVYDVRENISLGDVNDYRLCTTSGSLNMLEEIRMALPVTSYTSDLGDDLQVRDEPCPVCLSEFREREDIRQLPLCKHVFHSSCLDRWLDQQRATCPLCRSYLVPEDIARKQRTREHELAQELIFWLSTFHGSGLQDLWWQT